MLLALLRVEETLLLFNLPRPTGLGHSLFDGGIKGGRSSERKSATISPDTPECLEDAVLVSSFRFQFEDERALPGPNNATHGSKLVYLILFKRVTELERVDLPKGLTTVNWHLKPFVRQPI